MYNIGILSTASIVPRFIEGVRLSSSFRVLGIASRDNAKAKEYASKYLLERSYGSYEELLADRDIDIVYLPLINSLHFKYGKMAIESGKHVIIEKPFVLHKKEAIELFELAKQRKVFLMEAQKALFLKTTRRLKELLAGNIIGNVKYLEANLFFKANYPEEHWMNDHEKGGGCLYGSFSYPFELVSYLFPIDEYEAKANFIKGRGSSDCLALVQMHFGNKLFNIAIGMDIDGDNVLVIHGDKGSIRIKDFHRGDRIEIRTSEEAVIEKYPHQSEFVYELEHIAKCLDDGFLTSPVCTCDLTIRTVALVEELYEEFQ